MIIVGDIHGNIPLFETICNKYPGEDIVQVGDLDTGDDAAKDREWRNFFKGRKNIRFIRGNHDEKAILKTFEGFVPDGSVLNTNIGPMLAFGGAFSIDKTKRILKGKKWHSDEEVSQVEYYDIYETARNVQPAIILSHDGPARAVQNLIPADEKPSSRTVGMLDSLYDVCKPSLHIFGHHHVPYDGMHDDTRMICVALDVYMHLPEIHFVQE